MIRAILFDLDDTLYAQADWLAGAWAEVADVAAAQAPGLDRAAFLDALLDAAAAGSDRGSIIDRTLAATGADADLAPILVDAFRAHRSGALEPYDGAREAIALAARHGLVGLVTDGWPAVQRDKIRALGLGDAFDVIVASDELGREHRKPDPLPFRVALEALGVPAYDAVFVGDRPAKDVAGAHAAGLRAARVRTGEYRAVADEPTPWLSASDVLSAVRAIVGDRASR